LNRVFVGLGANLDDPAARLCGAIESLRQRGELKMLRLSSWYHTLPVGPANQPDYINAVAELFTDITPEELLALLQQIEAAHGRTREHGIRWGPRTLDLDILLYGNLILARPELQIPHRQMRQRGFVLVPLSQLAPELILPTGEAVKDLLAVCDTTGVRPYSPAPSVN
jgi:2-amino-4-hydroxy-6-hydroxymethyldihydropteridine diphosphokinase